MKEKIETKLKISFEKSWTKFLKKSQEKSYAASQACEVVFDYFHFWLENVVTEGRVPDSPTSFLYV